MSSTRIDQQQQSSSTSSSVSRRSSLVVNLSTIRKRSSVTRLLTSSCTSGSSRSRNENYYSDSGNSSGGSWALDSKEFSARRSSGLEVAGSCPQSAPPSLIKPSYCVANSSLIETTISPFHPIVEPKDSFICRKIDESSSTATDKTNPKRPISQVIEISNITSSNPKPSEDNQQSSTIYEVKSSRQNSKDDSPEPIVEVKHTSSSSSSGGSDSAHSSDNRDEHDSSNKLVRRKTVRRYHRACENRGPDSNLVCTELTISIKNPSSDNINDNSNNNSSQQVDNHRSQFRTRQIGSYYAQQQQQANSSSTKDTRQTKTSLSSSHISSSSSSLSSSKIAKCITHTTSNSSSSSSSSSSSRKSTTHLISAKGGTEKVVESGGCLIESKSETEMLGDKLIDEVRSHHTQPSPMRPALEVRVDDQFANRRSNLLSNANSSQFCTDKTSASRRSIAVQEEEESRIRHSRFSSSSMAAMKQSSSSSSSLIVSGNKSQQSRTQIPDFNLDSNDTLFSSPDVRSLVKEIGIDFAELENFAALSSSTSHSSRASLSTRLFPSRLPISPVGSTNSATISTDDSKYYSSGFSPLGEFGMGDSSFTRVSSTTCEDKNRGRSNGERISELISRAQNHVGDEKKYRLPSNNPTDSTPAAVAPTVTTLNTAATSDSNDANQHQTHCKAVMSVSIERIDQRMSDLCKKFNDCQDTKEAIDLLKIMIQTIEKAWSVPVCGDDLGFKLCNSLREAGGLDIILGFIQDADEQSVLTGEDAAQWMTVLLNGDNSKEKIDASETSTLMPAFQAVVEPTSAHAKNIGSSRPLKLNLSKLNNTSNSNNQSSASPVESSASPQMKLSISKLQTTTTAIAPKDSDSDILTSDLGLDSTSVESLSYVSAAQLSSPVVGSEEEPAFPTNEELKKVNKEIEEEEQNTELDNEVLDKEGKVAEDLAEEANLRKEELVFLSARLLSQCLTSENRNYIVNSGLESVTKLACKFTTMKSTQSHRLLSRSVIMRQSSTVSNSAVCKLQQQATPVGIKKPDLHQQNANSMSQKQRQQQKDTQQVMTLPGDELKDSGKSLDDHSDMHAIIGTEILQHLFKHSEDTCSKMISLGGLEAILYGCRSSNVETLRHCASALANLALYGGRDSQQIMIEEKAHVWLFPLAFNEDDNIQYYACLAIVVLAANQEIEADVLKSSTLNLVEPFVTSHEPQKFAESTTSHIHGQSASWLRKLIPLLESKREEARNLACFHFAMEAHIKREQGQTRVFKEIGALEPLRKVGSSPIAIASKFACQALRLIGEKEPHKLSQQVPLWTSEDVAEWVSQIGFERFKKAFVESRVDGDLLLQLDEEMLRTDIGIDNGIIRRRFLRELSYLKRIADYSSADRTGLSSLLSSTGNDYFVQYIYSMLQLGVTRDNIHLIDSEQLLHECKVSNTIHRLKLAHAIKCLQEKIATEASNELSLSGGADQKTLDVFVSYRRSTGSQLASLLKVHLQLRGFTVFIDVERLEAGKFDNNLLDSIKTARNFILVLSPNALDRCINDHECKDWVHKEIVAALASNCNIIPIIDNFHWPDTEQLPEDMRSISYFNGVRWIHDYQEACVEKIERFIRGEISNGSGQCSNQSSLQRLSGTSAGHYSSTPSMVATPSAYPSGLSSSTYCSSSGAPDYHPLSFASQFNAQNSAGIQLRRPAGS